jgi:hypothetical protein
MARMYPDSSPGGGREVTVDEFVADCFGQGDPFGPVEDGETVYYTNEPDGKIGIFIYNTIYEFSLEEFEQMKAKMPKVQFELEPPEGLEGFTRESVNLHNKGPVESQARQLVKNVLERVCHETSGDDEEREVEIGRQIINLLQGRKGTAEDYRKQIQQAIELAQELVDMHDSFADKLHKSPVIHPPSVTDW